MFVDDLFDSYSWATTMQDIPLDVIGHICSFLPLPDLLAFLCTSKLILKQSKTESFIQQCKEELFYNRWRIISKVDALPVPLSRKIETKISLQKNLTNPEFQPRAFAFPVIDGFFVQADVEHNMLYLEKTDGADSVFEIYNTETLQLKNQMVNDNLATKDKYWKGDPYIIYERTDFNAFEVDPGDRQDIWDLNTNQLWSMTDQVTYSSYIYKNLYVFLTTDNDFKVMDLATRKIIHSRRVNWYKMTVDIPNRLLFVVDPTSDGLLFVRYSHDWQEEIGRQAVPYRHEDEPPIENFWPKVGVIVLRKYHYFFSMQIDGQTQSRIYSRKTFQEVYRTNGACSHRQFDTFADFETNEVQGGEIYNIVDKTSYYSETFNDFKLITGDLYFQTVECTDFRYQFSVVRMPRIEPIIKITTEEGMLTDKFVELLEKQLNFSANYGIKLKEAVTDAFANESQIILTFQNTETDQIVAVALDYGDTVLK